MPVVKLPEIDTLEPAAGRGVGYAPSDASLSRGSRRSTMRPHSETAIAVVRAEIEEAIVNNPAKFPRSATPSCRWSARGC